MANDIPQATTWVGDGQVYSSNPQRFKHNIAIYHYLVGFDFSIFLGNTLQLQTYQIICPTMQNADYQLCAQFWPQTCSAAQLNVCQRVPIPNKQMDVFPKNGFEGRQTRMCSGSGTFLANTLLLLDGQSFILCRNLRDAQKLSSLKVTSVKASSQVYICRLDS